ncbi:MAG: carbohydrate ABC transporter permease [Deltaproteobacteria bacterium]|nr:carbohydrate ABC transporter permease [Deltaproteobacteria bacterium]
MDYQSHIVQGKHRKIPVGKIVSYVVFTIWIFLTVFPLVWMTWSSFKTNEELTLDSMSFPRELFDNINDEYIVIKQELNIMPDYDPADTRPRLIIESAVIGYSRRMMLWYPLKEELPPELANLKPGDGLRLNQLPPHIQSQISWLTIWYNFTQSFMRGGLAAKALNSLMYSVLGSMSIVLLSLMMGFGLSKMKFRRLSGVINATVGFGYLINITSVIIPLYLLMSAVGLTDTHVGVILVYTAFGLPMAVMLTTQFIRGLPDSLVESAFIDGAGTMRTFFQIIVPMSIPVAATIAIFNVLGIWNEFLLVLIVASTEGTKSLPVGVYSFSGLTSTQLGWQLAAMFMALLPVVIFYFVFNKQIAKGVVGGAIKG